MFIQNNPQSQNFKARIIIPTKVSDKFNKTATAEQRDIYKAVRPKLREYGDDSVYHALSYNDQGLILRTYREGTNHKMKSDPIDVRELEKTAKDFSEAV